METEPKEENMTAEAPDTPEAAKAASPASEAAAENTEEDKSPQENGEAETETAEETPEAEKEGAKPDPKDEKIRDLNDRLLRQMAEFENFRRRTEKEKSMMFDSGASSVIEKILPILDNFERAMATVTEEQKADPFVGGMEKIYKQMLTTLEQIGVTPIEAIGQEFDPQLHNAVMHIEDESLGENVVADEFQKGYKYHDMVVRHSMVKVAN